VSAVFNVSTSHSNVSRAQDTIEKNVNTPSKSGPKTSWITALALILVSLTISPAFAGRGGGGRGGFGGGGGGYHGGGGWGGYRGGWGGYRGGYGGFGGVGFFPYLGYGYGGYGGYGEYGDGYTDPSYYAAASPSYTYSNGYSGAPTVDASQTGSASYLTSQTYEPGDGYRYPLYFNPSSGQYLYYPVAK